MYYILSIIDPFTIMLCLRTLLRFVVDIEQHYQSVHKENEVINVTGMTWISLADSFKAGLRFSPIYFGFIGFPRDHLFLEFFPRLIWHPQDNHISKITVCHDKNNCVFLWVFLCIICMAKCKMAFYVEVAMKLMLWSRFPVTHDSITWEQ